MPETEKRYYCDKHEAYFTGAERTAEWALAVPVVDETGR